MALVVLPQSSRVWLIALGLLLASCAPIDNSVLSAQLIGDRSEYYHPPISMRIFTEDPTFGREEKAGYLPLRIVLGNDSGKAICLPYTQAPFPGGWINFVFRVWDTASGDELPLMRGRFVSDWPDLEDEFRAIPPGWRTLYVPELSKGFDLVPGKEYRVVYEAEGYYCAALEAGYPHTRYKHQWEEDSGLPFFDRSPSTVVKYKVELVFEAK